MTVLDQVARRIPVPDNDVSTRVGIDGPDASGKTFFADALAARLRAAGRPVLRVSVDDFHHVRNVRYQRGRDSAEGFWLYAFNYERLRADVLDPEPVAACAPHDRATILIDNTDPGTPRIVRA